MFLSNRPPLLNLYILAQGAFLVLNENIAKSLQNAELSPPPLPESLAVQRFAALSSFRLDPAKSSISITILAKCFFIQVLYRISRKIASPLLKKAVSY